MSFKCVLHLFPQRGNRYRFRRSRYIRDSLFVSCLRVPVWELRIYRRSLASLAPRPSGFIAEGIQIVACRSDPFALRTDFLFGCALCLQNSKIPFFIAKSSFKPPLLLTLRVFLRVFLFVLFRRSGSAETGNKRNRVMPAVHAEKPRRLSVTCFGLRVHMNSVSFTVLDFARPFSPGNHLSLPGIAKRPCTVVMAYLIHVNAVPVILFPDRRPRRVRHRGAGVHRDIRFRTPVMPAVINEPCQPVVYHLLDGCPNCLIERRNAGNHFAGCFI